MLFTTRATALALAELGGRAGFPAGVFNVLAGNDTREIGAELTSNPMVRKITFTGFTEVGRLLLAQSAYTIKKYSMELGGNAPFIVFDDADLDAAVDGLMSAKFRNNGESCIGANRVLVQSGVHDAVAEHIGDALSKDARLLHGGRRHALGGNLYEPTVLAAYLYSRDAARIWRIAARLESGRVGINCGLMSNELAPFGGVKQSGLGREGSHLGIDEYLDSRTRTASSPLGTSRCTPQGACTGRVTGRTRRRMKRSVQQQRVPPPNPSPGE